MADEEEVKEEKQKSSMVPIIGVAILCIGAGLGGGFFLFGQDKDKDASGDESGESTEASAGDESDAQTSSVSSGAKSNAGSQIAELGNQVLNLNDPLGARRLSLSISIEASPEVVALIENKAPQIKSEIIMLASSYSADQLNGLDGKMNFRDEVQIRINGILDSFKVDQVYFTEFLVQ